MKLSLENYEVDQGYNLLKKYILFIYANNGKIFQSAVDDVLRQFQD